MRIWSRAALIAATLVLGAPAAWADYPDRPLQIIVPLAKIPANVAQKLESACATTVQGPTFQTGMKELEQQIVYLTGDRFSTVLEADAQAKRRLIESTGIKREE